MKNYIKYCLSFLVLLLGACGTEPQDPTVLFLDGKMPKKLQNLANQLGELKQLQAEIVAQAESDNGRKDLVTVAVIDNGVDLAHPDLYKKWAADIVDGKLAGIGFDVLGTDNWASSNLVRAHIFAVGAKDITEDAKIVDAREDPLADLKKVNDAFRAHLFKVLSESPELKNTPFVTETLKSKISMTAVYGILKNLKSHRRVIREATKDNRLLDLTRPFSEVRAEMAKRWEEKPEGERGSKMTFNLDVARVGAYYNGRVAWFPGGSAMDSMLENGSYSPLYSFTQSGAFLDALERAWTTFDQKDAYYDLARPLSLFQAARQSKKTYRETKEAWANLDRTAIPTSTSPAPQESLDEYIALKEKGLKALDPRIEYAESLRAFLQTYINIIWAIEEKTSLPEIAPKTMPEQMVMLSKILDQGVEYLKNRPEMTDEERISLDKTVKRVKAVQAIMAYIAKDIKDNPDVSGGLRKELFQESLPYLSPESASVSHGSHVSGIILKQDERLRVYPIRVATSKIQTSKDQSEILEDEFRADFKTWMSNPVVARAMLIRFPQLEAQSGMKHPEDYATLLAFLEKQFSPLIETDFNSSFELDYRFIKDLHAAIKRVGERGIKVASASLGTGFKAPPAEGHFQDGRLEWRKVLEFLFFECMKSKTAGIIKDNAPNTLFVIATGNDGAWKDGYSQSALPVDLSSPFLKKAERPEQGETMPNNHMTNVVGVASLNPEGQLSGFTNILINSPTPMVFAEGENILSPIKKSDNEAVSNLLSPYELAPALKAMMDGVEGFVKDKAKAAGKTPELAKLNETMARATISLAGMEVEGMLGVLSRIIISRIGNNRARMSGTSMATPAVSGMLGKLIAEKAAKLGVSTRELYTHPDFSPAQLIKDLVASAETTVGQFPLIKLLNQEKWAPSEEEQGIVKLIEEWLKDTELKVVDPKSISRSADSARPAPAPRTAGCEGPLS